MSDVQKENGGASVIINGQRLTTTSTTLTWEQAVDFAFPGGRTDPDLDFIVTYEDAGQTKVDGTLGAGQTIQVREVGTLLHVKKHRRS